MDPTIDIVHTESATASSFEVSNTVDIRRGRYLGRLGFIQADILSTPFLFGYEELWGSLEPIADTRPPSVLFFAVVHYILCRLDSAVLLDAEWASKCFALEVQSPNTPF
jgi:hypothetical protein